MKLKTRYTAAMRGQRRTDSVCYENTESHLYNIPFIVHTHTHTHTLFLPFSPSLPLSLCLPPSLSLTHSFFLSFCLPLSLSLQLLLLIRRSMSLSVLILLRRQCHRFLILTLISLISSLNQVLIGIMLNSKKLKRQREERLVYHVTVICNYYVLWYMYTYIHMSLFFLLSLPLSVSTSLFL